MNSRAAVDVWFLDKISLETLSYPWEDVLSAQEQLRAKRFIFKDDKQSFIIYHACQRLILSDYLQQNPKDIMLSFQEKGKPIIKYSSVTFNLSHTKDAAVFVVATDAHIGVDLEKIKKIPHCLALAKRFFHAEEYHQLKNIKNDSLQQEVFLLLWTAKEAIVKATGEGLVAGLNHFCVQPNLLFQGRLAHTYPENIALARLDVPANYVASIAMLGDLKPLTYQSFSLKQGGYDSKG
jgi:4'-phosphopantetheinyl transferase